MKFRRQAQNRKLNGNFSSSSFVKDGDEGCKQDLRPFSSASRFTYFPNNNGCIMTIPRVKKSVFVGKVAAPEKGYKDVKTVVFDAE